MSDPKTPVSGGNASKGAPDGVSGSPETGAAGNVQGRTAGGESGGGGYDNPHTGKDGSNSGFLGHGGQTQIDYHGGGQTGAGGDAPNAATGSDSSDGTERGSAAWAAPHYDAHPVGDPKTGRAHSFSVIETNGIAQAEATAKVGTDAPYEREQEQPGSG